MAALFSSSFSNISPSSSLTVTQEEFNAFHKIDRAFFTRLVLGLNRDMYQSLEVFSFLFLIEQIGYARDLIAYLVTLSDAFIDEVANEIVVCLSTLHNQCFSSTFFDDDLSFIPHVIHLTRGKITLRSIHQNRESILLGVRNNLNDICYRAFEDICVRVDMYNQERVMAMARGKMAEEMKKIRLSFQLETTSRMSVQRERVLTLPAVQPETTSRVSVQQGRVHTLPVVKEANNNVVVTEKEVADKEEEELVADDRTVFLTFSKGYPISETEVRVYFTKKFGEMIEAIEMQEVEENEQPLYARMVLKSNYANKLEAIVSERNRNKFTINGKHVWARKYVPKNPSPVASFSHV